MWLGGGGSLSDSVQTDRLHKLTDCSAVTDN